ncbi:MAG: CPBP family intramembrane metalloprotease [Oscillospiraceae bacterium]|nr:CPBP family intramembrane metalloprotease [Oscillospiraceae bacterium]
MKNLAVKKPVLFGIVSALIVFIVFTLVNLLLGNSISTPVLRVWMDGALRIVFGILSVVLLGYIIKSNGFKFVFSTKGFAKGIFACLPVLLICICYIAILFDIVKINKDFLPQIPARIFQQTAVGFFEESLFRGLMITAFLIKFGGTAKGRINAALITAILFGLIHLFGFLTSGGDILEYIFPALNAMLLGLAFSAVFIYSKNLLSAMIVHSLYDYFVVIVMPLVVMNMGTPIQIVSNIALIIILFAVMPVFSIILIIKAKPFGNVVDKGLTTTLESTAD